MKNTLQDIIFSFARARTAQQRTTALYLASTSTRFDEDQKNELNRLLTEARGNQTQFVPVRPTIKATQDCADLVDLVVGPDPTLPVSISEKISEWIACWNVADELRAQQIELPGPCLLYGATGTGKTTLTRSLVSKLEGRTACVLDAHRCVDSHLGSTGERLSKAFAACERTGAFLVIEELDAFAEARGGEPNAATQEATRINVAVMRLLESATFPVIATTNRRASLDVALLRRFELHLELPEVSRGDRIKHLTTILGETPTDEMLSVSLSDAVRMCQRNKRVRFLDKRNRAAAA